MSDGLAARFPVSVKGVVERGGRFVLLKNERDEWELPGGKLEPGETIEDCLVREIAEELNLSTRIGRPLNNWVYYVNGVHVLIITYALQILDEQAEMAVSHEHKELRSFPLEEIAGLLMPDGYKQSIAAYADKPGGRSNGEPDQPG